MKNVLTGVVATLVFFGLFESTVRVVYLVRNAAVTAVPLPYVIGHSYGPEPPWLERLVERDASLMWRARPHLRRAYVDVFTPAWSEDERRALFRRFRPTLPSWVAGNPLWTVALNSEGFREAELPHTKKPGAFRIVCLGDSWTFGTNVGPEQTYPRRLAALLAEAFPSADFEVLNLGVLGYSSEQGLRLLKQRVLALDPDLLIVAFAMNDSSVAGFRDRDVLRSDGATTAQRLAGALTKAESYRLLRYLALLARDEPPPMSSNFATAASRFTAIDGSTRRVYAGLESWTRVPLADSERNVVEMIRLARGRGAGVLLLYNELWQDNPYREVLRRAAAAEGVPLVDSSAVIAEAKRRIEAAVETQLELRAPVTFRSRADGDGVEVVFRVYLGDRPVPKAVSIVGSHPQLGNLVPNTVLMHDDGTHGDQRAGDHVWSYSATFPAGTTVFYVYTNSGGPGRWEGLDVPDIRRFTVPGGGAGRVVYRPIESFGKLYMQADSWHTDAAGYELIAHAVFDALGREPKVARYVADIAKQRR